MTSAAQGGGRLGAAGQPAWRLPRRNRRILALRPGQQQRQQRAGVIGRRRQRFPVAGDRVVPRGPANPPAAGRG